MQLKQWRLTQEKTLEECATLLGVGGARTYQRYECGENRADADLVDVIANVTHGAVTPADMHEVRLAWLRANRPDKFVEAAE